MAFERGGKKLWTKAKTTINTTLYPDAPSPGFRHLELDGKTIWAACACDAVGGQEMITGCDTQMLPGIAGRLRTDGTRLVRLLG
jgi:hypothetical protein